MARKVIVSKFKIFSEVLRVCTFVYCNGVFEAGLCSTKLNSNETLQLDTRELNAAFSHWIPSFVQLTVQMSKLNEIGRTHRKRLCSRTENFARPFTTNKLFERIQILNGWKFRRFHCNQISHVLTFQVLFGND